LRPVAFTGRFRELAVAIALLPTSTLILDGEVAVFDEHLLSRRDLLRRPDPRAVVTPPIFITFDCAHADGRDLRHYPLGARREVLETVLAGQRLLLAARRLPAHGLEAWAEVQRRGYEGLVAKDETSAYLGGRTRSWLKVKRRNGDGARSANGATRDSVQFSVEPRHCMLLGEKAEFPHSVAAFPPHSPRHCHEGRRARGRDDPAAGRIAAGEARRGLSSQGRRVRARRPWRTVTAPGRSPCSGQPWARCARATAGAARRSSRASRCCPPG